MKTQSFTSRPITNQQRSMLQLLFARYITGQLTEAAWNKFTEVFDSVDASRDHRLAFAAFFTDAAREHGTENIQMPRADELGELIGIIRA